MTEDDLEYLWKISGPEPTDMTEVTMSNRTANDYVPDYLQPFTPVEFYLPEISSMRLIKDIPLFGGRHVEVRMANGWGVSIINHWGAFGGLEVGFRPPGPHEINDLGAPPFHDDEVMGHLDQRGLIEVLSQVHHLPKERDEGTTG